jgi:hypothetical protein
MKIFVDNQSRCADEISMAMSIFASVAFNVEIQIDFLRNGNIN